MVDAASMCAVRHGVLFQLFSRCRLGIEVLNRSTSSMEYMVCEHRSLGLIMGSAGRFMF